MGVAVFHAGRRPGYWADRLKLGRKAQIPPTTGPQPPSDPVSPQRVLRWSALNPAHLDNRMAHRIVDVRLASAQSK